MGRTVHKKCLRDLLVHGYDIIASFFVRTFIYTHVFNRKYGNRLTHIRVLGRQRY